MNTAQKRRDEIEAKKAKLAELKRLRGERQLSFPLSRATSGIGEPAAVSEDWVKAFGASAYLSVRLLKLRD